MKITDALIKKSCSPTIYRRGMEYFREGRVHLRRREKNYLSAVVDGEHIYNVTVKFNNDEIEECLCTCPYFETMGCVCKHIAATMKQRQTELDEGENYTNENDKIARSLCESFASKATPKNIIHVKFHLYINQPTLDTTYFSMALEMGNGKGVMQGVENFLEQYLNKKSFAIDRHTEYIPGVTEFMSPQKEIIDILAETYENHSPDEGFYTKAAYQTSFGQMSASRILSLLANADFSLTYNGLLINDARISEGDPDIIIDINAVESGICLSVNERGYALIRDGSFFLYDGIIYHTSEEWRSYFMPIYNALATESRTQITFEGANTLAFATHALPMLRHRHGVVTDGIDHLVVDEKPVFEIYFDSRGASITAAIIARYGGVAQRLPVSEESNSTNKIIVRDIVEETNILSYFEGFRFENGLFVLGDNKKIYEFLTQTLPDLQKKATIVSSVLFEKIQPANISPISASVSYNSELDLLETDFETELSDDEIIGILSAIRLKESFYRMKDGSFIPLDRLGKKNVFSLLERLDFTEDELIEGKKLLPTYNALYLDSVRYIEKNQTFTDYIDTIRSMKANIPDELSDVLRLYQKNGLTWLKQLSSLGFGGILADDMGLGKTLQVLAYILGEKPAEPVLIVTPSALTYNWYSEIMRFTPSLRTLIIDGSKEHRTKLIESVGEYDVIITSYPLLRRDTARYAKLEFSYCFIDEAQYIKNPKTKNALSVKKINATHKFALTGTPIENSLTELWSIFDFVMNGYLGKLSDFRTRYMSPSSDGENEFLLEDLKTRVKPFILRRMKNEVLAELPEKIEHTYYADLTSEQRNIYSAYLALAKRRTLALEDLNGQNRIQILSLLTRLRQICCHPALFDENYASGSGKLELLCELTEAGVSSGHRLLIFSQYTSMLSIIRESLDKKKIKCFYLDGKTASYERLEMADRFNSGERDVFLISLKAGGTGLNLTGADTVIHYDPWWNPAAMDQASDRAYRIGQTKAVQVMKLVSKGTIEEKIIKLQEAKRSLANDIVQINHDTLSSLSREEILSLFED